jgi:hypothetical protein
MLELQRIVSMLPRLLQRTATVADDAVEYEYEYRDAEYEYEENPWNQTVRSEHFTPVPVAALLCTDAQIPERRGFQCSTTNLFAVGIW